MDYFEVVRKHQTRVAVKPRNLRFYMTEQLFNGIDFSDKTFLDIGAGIGMFGLYAASNGAKSVDLLEPELEGCAPGMIDMMHGIMNDCGLNNAHHIKSTIQEHSVSEPYDIVLSHNAINHYDEDACVELLTSAEARERYDKNVFGHLSQYTKPGGLLIVSDCGRRNFFGDLGMTSPLMKGIEWEKHQEGKTWARLLSSHGFDLESIRYTSINTLGKLGALIMNNRLVNYLTLSHFILHLRKRG